MLFEALWSGFQSLGICQWIIQLQGTLFGIFRRTEIDGKRRGLDVEVHGAEEKTADMAQRHPRRVGLAVGAVARNVRRGNEGAPKEFLIHMGLVLPGVEDDVADGPVVHRPEQSALIDDASTGSIDEDAAT